jgi:hypothetical protein
LGDYAFFMDANFNFDLVQLVQSFLPLTADNTSVTADSGSITADDSGGEGGGGAGTFFQFAPNLSRLYPAGGLVWPVLFGKFSMDKQSGTTSWHAGVKVTLAELVSRHQPIIGNAPAPGHGIGAMAIGSTDIVG